MTSPRLLIPTTRGRVDDHELSIVELRDGWHVSDRTSVRSANASTASPLMNCTRSLGQIDGTIRKIQGNGEAAINWGSTVASTTGERGLTVTGATGFFSRAGVTGAKGVATGGISMGAPA